MISMKENIYHSQSNNVMKTWIYLIFFSLLVGALGYFLATVFNNPLFFYLGAFISIGSSIYSYWFSSTLVLKMANAIELKKGENDELEKNVEIIATEAGIPMPKIYIVNDPSPNAFATGRNPENGCIAFTTGILSLLNQEELAGVIAHELSHIRNRDTLIMTVVAVMASTVQSIAHFAYFFGGNRNRENNIFISIVAMIVIAILAPLAATIIQMAISRKREFLADASSALLTNRPKDLADALIKINNYPQGLQNINPSIAHLFISDPEKSQPGIATPWYVKLFMTHPPVGERVAALIGRN